MDRQGANFEQLLPDSEKAKHNRPLPLYRPHLESKTSVMTTTSMAFSIQETTPHLMKDNHTMFKANQVALSKFNAAQPKAFVQKLDNDLEKMPAGQPLNHTISEKLAVTCAKDKAQSLIQVGGLMEYAAKRDWQNLQQLQVHAPKKSVDASTQVFTQRQKGLYSNLIQTIETCDFEGCMEVATAGLCDYRVCCSRGCQRSLCNQHHAATVKKGQDEQQEESIDDFSNANTDDLDRTNFKNRVCVECENRANRAFWITLFFVILLPVMAAMPAIIMYGGGNE